MKEINFTIKKTPTGYNIEYSKNVNLVSYGPGENEHITEKHSINVFESSLTAAIKRILKDEEITK